MSQTKVGHAREQAECNLESVYQMATTAVRIIGTLEDCQPHRCHIEYQDWGTPSTELPVTAEQEEMILEYSRCFY